MEYNTGLKRIRGASMERRLTAILAADVVGYSRLMGEDEVGTLGRTVILQALFRPLVEHHSKCVKQNTSLVLRLPSHPCSSSLPAVSNGRH